MLCKRLIAALLFVTAPAWAHKLDCGVKEWDAKKKQVVIQCPPPMVYSPLRVEAYLTGEAVSPRVGSLCTFSSNGSDSFEIEYQSEDGRKHWTRMDGKARFRFVQSGEIRH